MKSAALSSFAIAFVLLPVAAYSNMMMPDLTGMQSMTGLQLPQMGQLPQINMPTFGNLMPQMQQNGNSLDDEDRIPCSCGIFLNGQFKRGSLPTGNAALLQELTETFQCNAVGEKQCQNKCLETIMRHLPNSPIMVCGSIDRDCHKERAYLFVKNCKDRWINTNLSAGREYCCKDGVPYKCPP